MTVTGCYQFRLTRNSDLHIEEENIDDLANALKSELLTRRYGIAVRLEIESSCPESLYQFLCAKHGLTLNDVYFINGPVNLSRYRTLVELLQRPDLKYPPFTPALPKRLRGPGNLFDAIRKGDVLLHHPFESFVPVIDFIRQAARDPAVLAIKATVYRTGARSEFVKALIEAARAGKEVTAVVELRARFDEEENIALASLLQEAGVLIVYGVFGYKTHAKMTLIVRREGSQLRRYAHLGTGNYHEKNARLYTDFSLLTFDSDITQDVQSLFQQLTGMGRVVKLKKILQAPFTLANSLCELIEQERKNALAGKEARIIVKINALTDSKMIRALYEASQAGVRIDLIVRGACTLRPGIQGLSENIRVRSVVGRFLEHSRIYYFFQPRG